MIRRLVRAAITGAVVSPAAEKTSAALRVDPIILRAANILPLEEVEILHVATGSRFTTWAEAASEGSGIVSAPWLRAGDAITVVSYGLLHDGQTIAHRAKLVTLDAGNRVVAISES